MNCQIHPSFGTTEKILLSVIFEENKQWERKLKIEENQSNAFGQVINNSNKVEIIKQSPHK